MNIFGKSRKVSDVNISCEAGYNLQRKPFVIFQKYSWNISTQSLTLDVRPHQPKPLGRLVRIEAVTSPDVYWPKPLKDKFRVKVPYSALTCRRTKPGQPQRQHMSLGLSTKFGENVWHKVTRAISSFWGWNGTCHSFSPNLVERPSDMCWVS